ncbi:aldehyde dehydrogenase (NAD+) [Rhodococcus wratislaviensis]|uniref:Aldehyde dehydrogenase n=1 Tax=Rhodococcus wratislaviensis TaxID=44752 RepID=A0AB38FFQ2_RHOWR|nr:aldehyde dehydrogenase family protein [Rhodococcus wratislaviensis]REE71539.1 aldehyde dehydrogenase (NAD+) [Rhodococcus wratislaviensis]SPZ40475.1 aldehyde dehydrogenase [Rhodococcus wratislaviensis]
MNEYPISKAARKSLARDVFGHVVDGRVVPSLDGKTMDIIDPARGEVVARAALGDQADVERVVTSSRQAFDDGRWRLLDPLEKERRLRKMGKLLLDRRDEVAELDVIDAGLLRWYVDFTVDFAANGIDYYSGWPTKIHGSIPPTPPNFSVRQERLPIGVIGLITPWNGPISVFGSVAAALATGNAVILKPAEQTPMTAVLMGEIASEAGIPAGVFNVLQGRGATVGAALVEHPGVDAISFTGSVPTGSAIQAAAAKRVKRVSLELGGKSAFIVFPDADIAAAATAAQAAVWGASGQVCTAGSRVLVHSSIQDEFTAAVLAGTQGMKVGSGFDPATQLGPLVSAEQLDRVSSYVDIGKNEGATLASGGSRLDMPGYFHEPTVFTGVTNDMRIAQEEIFGPVMAVLSFDDEAEAIRIANDTNYGLAAGVWTSDLDTSQRVSAALNAGTVWINSYQMVYPGVSFGGVKLSGHGRNLGEASIGELTQVKSVWTKVGATR